MRAALLAGLATITLAAPASAQHSGHAGHMPGMAMPVKPAAKPALKRKPVAKPAARRAQPRTATERPAPKSSRPAAVTQRPPAPAADPHAGHDMSSLQHGGQTSRAPADPHAGHTTTAEPQVGSAGHDTHAGHDMGSSATTDHSAPVGTNLPAGNAPAPTAFPGSAASRFYGEAVMVEEARDLKREHGGGIYRQVVFNLAEAQIREGRDGYRWDGEGWIGGDINRFVVRTEGAGDFGRPVDDAEVQLLYSRALDPYLNLQAGVRYDFKPNPSRTYASIGFEALAPYFFDVEGTLFLSDKGDVLARAEAYYDQRLTNWFVLQPRAELNFAVQDMPENGIGSGLSDIELGLRLRYELRREFVPYIGVSWDRKLGDTARYARAEGESTGEFSFVTGVRVWF